MAQVESKCSVNARCGLFSDAQVVRALQQVQAHTRVGGHIDGPGGQQQLEAARFQQEVNRL